MHIEEATRKLAVRRPVHFPLLFLLRMERKGLFVPSSSSEATSASWPLVPARRHTKEYMLSHSPSVPSHRHSRLSKPPACCVQCFDLLHASCQMHAFLLFRLFCARDTASGGSSLLCASIVALLFLLCMSESDGRFTHTLVCCTYAQTWLLSRSSHFNARAVLERFTLSNSQKRWTLSCAIFHMRLLNIVYQLVRGAPQRWRLPSLAGALSREDAAPSSVDGSGRTKLPQLRLRQVALAQCAHGALRAARALVYPGRLALGGERAVVVVAARVAAAVAATANGAGAAVAVAAAVAMAVMLTYSVRSAVGMVGIVCSNSKLLQLQMSGDHGEGSRGGGESTLRIFGHGA
eukprot:6196658-Pleurochrysis_carterae.AAC.1